MEQKGPIKWRNMLFDVKQDHKIDPTSVSYHKISWLSNAFERLPTFPILHSSRLFSEAVMYCLPCKHVSRQIVFLLPIGLYCFWQPRSSNECICNFNPLNVIYNYMSYAYFSSSSILRSFFRICWLNSAKPCLYILKFVGVS